MCETTAFVKEAVCQYQLEFLVPQQGVVNCQLQEVFAQNITNDGKDTEKLWLLEGQVIGDKEKSIPFMKRGRGLNARITKSYVKNGVKIFGSLFLMLAQDQRVVDCNVKIQKNLTKLVMFFGSVVEYLKILVNRLLSTNENTEQKIPAPHVQESLNDTTASPSMTTNNFLKSKTTHAQFVTAKKVLCKQTAGRSVWQSIIATSQTKYVAFCALIATEASGFSTTALNGCAQPSNI